MKQSLTALLLAGLMVSAHAHTPRKALIPTKKQKFLKGYWRRVKSTDKQKLASLKILNEREDEKKARQKKKAGYLADLYAAKQIDKKLFLENKKTIWEHGLKNNTEPFTFMMNFNSKYYHGVNLELLNGSNGCDYYSFMQYLLDTGIYIHPHLQHLEKETIEFKAMVRMKGIAGDAGRYFRSKPQQTKVGWAITEFETNTNIDKFSLWMREIWLKYYFDEDKKSFVTTGFFPYSIGHGISLGNGVFSKVGIPIPGFYIFSQIDQFKPGVLFSSTFANDQALWELYFGFGTNYNTTFQRNAECAEATSTQSLLNVSRGTDKHNYILSGQIKGFIPSKNPDTECLINPYFVFNYDNAQTVEFEADSSSQLFTLGSVFEWENGPLHISMEGALNLGHQKVRAWDRNEVFFSAKTWNSHILLYDPEMQGFTHYPETAAQVTAAAENTFTVAPGAPPSPTFTQAGNPIIPAIADYSRRFTNGTKFQLYTSPGTLPNQLLYRNSFSRLRNAYKNKYRGWFFVADTGYQFNTWYCGGSMGLISGDTPPNDSPGYILATRRFENDHAGTPFVYKDTNKTYKGFVGLNEMFESKSINPFFIHEAQKLNCPLTKCDGLTTPQLTNLFFVGIGLKQHSVYNQKERKGEINIIAYAQHKQTLKGTSLPYTEYVNLEYSEARQKDAEKRLDPFLGVELNASLYHKLTYDLEASAQVAFFIPGKYYRGAEGKYLPYKKQADLVVANNSGIFTVPEQFNVSLGKDTAFLATVGIAYNFDSLLLKNKQKAFDPKKNKS